VDLTYDTWESKTYEQKPQCDKRAIESLLTATMRCRQFIHLLLYARRLGHTKRHSCTPERPSGFMNVLDHACQKR
jgi:hypothetical protein